MREQRKSPVRELTLSPVREDQSLVRVTSKQSESNDKEKGKKIRSSSRFLTSMPPKQMAMNLKESHRVCRA